MHICFASMDYPSGKGGGGIGTYVQSIGHELVKRGHRVSVIAIQRDRESTHTEDQGVQVYWIKSSTIHWYISKILFIGKLLALPIREIEYSNAVLKKVREIDKKDPLDIVEACETGAAGCNRLRPGIRTIIRLHGERFTSEKYTPPYKIPVDVVLSRLFQRRAMRNVHCLTSPSQGHAIEIAEELNMPRSCIRVVPNPIGDVSVFKQKRTEYLSERETNFLFIGRLEKRKGVIEFINAAARVLNKIPMARFCIAGNNHPSIKTKTIDALVSELEMNGKINFLGHLSKQSLETQYVQSSVVVVPSYYETFGYVYLEALLHGIPVVAFDVGPSRDFITNGKNGFLVPPGDINALAEACVSAVDLRVEVGKEQFDRYLPARICDEMVSLYENMLRDN